MIAEVDSMLECYQRNCKFQSCLHLHFPWHCLPEISIRVISTLTKLSGSVEELSCHSWKLYSDPKMWDCKTHAVLQVWMSKHIHSCGDLRGRPGCCLREVFFLLLSQEKRASLHSPLCSFPQTAVSASRLSQLLYKKKHLSKPTLTSWVQCQLSEQNK